MYTGEEKRAVAPITLVSKSGLPRLGVFLPRVVKEFDPSMKMAKGDKWRWWKIKYGHITHVCVKLSNSFFNMRITLINQKKGITA